MSATIAVGPFTALRERCHRQNSSSTQSVVWRDHARMTVVSSSIEIDAPPNDVYALLSDVTRTGEWSPECVRCRWLDGATFGDALHAFKGGGDRVGVPR